MGSLYVSWETAYLPLPQVNIKTYFSLRAKCWLRGGVGAKITRNVFVVWLAAPLLPPGMGKMKGILLCYVMLCYVFGLATRVVMAGLSRDFSLGPTNKDFVLAALLRQTANVRYSGLQFLNLSSIICFG